VRPERAPRTQRRSARLLPDTTPLYRELEPFASFATAAKGDVLFRSDDPASGLYLLQGGSVSLMWTTRRSVRGMKIARAGSVIGIAAALNGVHNLTARATFDTSLGFVSVRTLVQLMESNSQIRNLVATEIAFEVLEVHSFIAANCRRIGWRL
jgi:CRP-like cAMP-binding protein